PTTPDEVALAIKCTAEAKAAKQPWARTMIVATCAYNVAALGILHRASNLAVPTKNLRGTTTVDLMGKFWMDAAKYSSGTMRDAAARMGLLGTQREEGGAARGNTPQQRGSGSGGKGSGSGARSTLVG
ncbi:unnamed protein product, partial [Ectocarpus sp. 13 AM-2016]